MIKLMRFGFILLLVPLFGAAEVTPKDPLENFLATTTHLRGAFVQVIFDERGEKLQESSGDFIFMRPGKFRWHYLAPYEQKVICDGETVWIYDIDLAQVTTKAIDATFATSPAMVLLGKEPIAQRFLVTDLGETDGVTWLELTARHAASEFEQISIGFKKGELQEMKVVDGFGQTTQLTFSALDRTTPNEPTSYTFVAPPGIEVVSHE